MLSARQGDPVRVGLVGCGNFGGRAHAPAYGEVEGAVLAAVWDVDEARAGEVAIEAGAEPVGSFDDLLGRDDLDMVDLCAPTPFHAGLTVQALQAGKHVLCEKPMALTVDDAMEMKEAARASGRKLMIGQLRRFDSRFRAVKERLVGGGIGRPRVISRAEKQWLPLPATAWQWHPDRGGGVMVDVGVHATDLLRWYLAEDPAEVYAVGRTSRAEAREAGTPDVVHAVFSFPSGAVGTVEVSWGHPPEFGPFYGALDVLATGGKIHLSDQRGNPMLWVGRDRLSVPRPFPFLSTTPEAVIAELSHFVECIRHNREPAVTIDDAFRATTMALGAVHSLGTGAPVQFTESGVPT